MPWGWAVGRVAPMLVLLPRTAAASGITVRRATPADDDAIAYVAAVDSSAPPSGDVLVATDHAGVVAALGLHDGKVVADPFVRTDDVVALLRTRAGQLTRGRGRTPRRRLLDRRSRPEAVLA